MTHHAVLQALEEAVHDLFDDLEPIRQQIVFKNQSMAIGHNAQDTIFVFIPSEYKAYVPKKYNGFQVIIRSETEIKEIMEASNLTSSAGQTGTVGGDALEEVEVECDCGMCEEDEDEDA